MYLPSPVRVNRGQSPLDISGLVEWFDFRRFSRKLFLPPREMTSISISSGVATISCEDHAVLQRDATAFTLLYRDTVVLSGLEGDLSGLNGTHLVDTTPDNDTLTISTGLPDTDGPVGVAGALLDTEPRRVTSVYGLLNKFRFVGLNHLRVSMPYEAGVDGVRFVREGDATSIEYPIVNSVLEFDSWPSNIPQPFTLFCVMVDRTPVNQAYTYCGLIGASSSFANVPLIGIHSVATNSHRGVYFAGGTLRQSSSNILTRDAKHIIVARLQSGNHRFWRNGGTALLNTDPGTGGINEKPRISDTANLKYGGRFDIYDWLLYSGGLSAANINLIGNYLSQKTGAPWSSVT